jgi:hypothetical protein
MHPILAYQIARTLVDDDLWKAEQEQYRRARREGVERRVVQTRPRRSLRSRMSILVPRPR